MKMKLHRYTTSHIISAILMYRLKSSLETNYCIFKPKGPVQLSIFGIFVLIFINN